MMTKITIRAVARNVQHCFLRISTEIPLYPLYNMLSSFLADKILPWDAKALITIKHSRDFYVDENKF